MPAKFKLVQRVDGDWIEDTWNDVDSFISAMEIRGFSFSGVNRNPKQREELQDQPKFARLLGPMYDGERDGHYVVRYENQEANDALSV